MLARNSLFAVTLFVTSSSIFACTASENFDIYFPNNSSEIPGVELIRLANWVADQKIAYASHKTGESSLISGHAQEDEREPAKLATRRLSAGLAVLQQFGFRGGEIKTTTLVYSHRDVVNGRRVEISFEPECPNRCCNDKQ